MKKTNRNITLVLLATSALITPSLAQAATPAPKFLDTIDDHGVDLANGLPFLEMEEGGIGSGPGRVAMQRIFAEGAGWTDNWAGGLFKVTSGSSTLFYVQIGGLSDTFIYAAGNGPYTNTKGTGATLIKEAAPSAKYL